MPIQDELLAFLRKSFYAPADLDPDASLTDAGIVDSRGMLELIAFVEQTYGIVVLDRDIHPDNFDTLALAAAYVRARIERGATAGAGGIAGADTGAHARRV